MCHENPSEQKAFELQLSFVTLCVSLLISQSPAQWSQAASHFAGMTNIPARLATSVKWPTRSMPVVCGWLAIWR